MGELTLSYLSKVEVVHPAEFTERVGSVEDHCHLDWTTRSDR